MFKIEKLTVFLALGMAVFLGPVPMAQGQTERNSDFRPVLGSPLFASDFVRTTPHGFGDRHNSWAQSMIWWHDNLYVGTTRDSLCAALAEVNFVAIPILGQAGANQFLPYPPPDPDLSCAPDAANLPLQAEIWRWSPLTFSWTRVYQSPNVLPNPGTGPPAPPRTGKFVPYEIGFRGFVAHTENNGTEALYAVGVNSTLLW